MTGGQLVAAAGDRFGSFFSVTRSQVYRELPALADAGLRPARASRAPAPSQQYVITAAGQARVQGVADAERGADPLRSPLVLRLAARRAR